MTQQTDQIGYDLPEQQKRNGRQTYGRVTVRHSNGDALKITGAVLTAVRKALDNDHLTGTQAEAIRFYQGERLKMEDMKAVRMSKIRVDGGRLDLGEKILRKGKAAQCWRESRMMVPAVIYHKRGDKIMHPRNVFDRLLEDPEHAIEKLGAIYRPDLNSVRAMNDWGYRAIKFIGECLEGLCDEHKEMLRLYHGS